MRRPQNLKCCTCLLNLGVKSKFLEIILLASFVCGCDSVDLSTPEKAIESLYYAISKKDDGLYAKCFYEHGEFKNSEIKQGTRGIFAHFEILRHKILQKENVGPDEVKFTMEEVLQKDNGLKFVSTFVVMYIRVGKEWKILSTTGIETKKIK